MRYLIVTVLSQCRVLYSRIYWWVSVNGAVNDARLQVPQDISPALVNATLPNGSPLTVISDDTIFDVQLSLSSCYRIISSSVVTDYVSIQQALKTALLGKFTNLNNNASMVVVQAVGNDEYVYKNGYVNRI